MWLTSWMLSFIPDTFFVWVSYALVAVGVGLYIISKIVRWLPLLSQYKFPAEILGIIFLTVGAYVFGSYGTEMVWRERVRELEEKVAIAEQKSKEKNIEIRTKIVEKIKEVKVVQEVVKNIIVEKERVIDAQCKVAPEAIDILNMAATGQLKEEKK
jgi:hypothetical protein